MSILSVRDISKKYKFREVVKGISLEISSGGVRAMAAAGRDLLPSPALVIPRPLHRMPRLAERRRDTASPFSLLIVGSRVGR